MILLALVLLPLLGAFVAAAAAKLSPTASRWLALLALAAGLVLTLLTWHDHQPTLWTRSGRWVAEMDWPWMPTLGIHLHLAADGLSLLLILLTFLLGMAAVLVSWREISQRVGFFHGCLLAVLAGVVAVFLAVDLFLFYFAWELMLVPMYFLIAIWGHENRRYAAVKFFLFTQASGLLMLLAILALVFVHHGGSGELTFQYDRLVGTPVDGGMARWIMLGFLAAFAVKLPVVPLHTWLPDAHTEAPTAGSIVLAGLLLKTGGYGIIRFILPIFPEAVAEMARPLMILSVVGILYGAVLAFAQSDLKRLVAYTSVSHMGFVMLGLFAQTPLAFDGAVVQMLAHGLSTGALFAVAGLLQLRLHTRDLAQMNGLWATAPFMGGLTMAFVMSSVGLPGLGDFVGELLVLLGTYGVSKGMTVVVALVMVFSVTYGLKLVQDVFHGPNPRQWKMPDLLPREASVLLGLLAILFWLGLRPQIVLDAVSSPSAGAAMGASAAMNGR